ncbi:uncharacterized protein LOC144279045 [Eretmochelys imbricata]
MTARLDQTAPPVPCWGNGASSDRWGERPLLSPQPTAAQCPLALQIPQILLDLTPLDPLGPPNILPIDFFPGCALRCPSPLGAAWGGRGWGGTDQPLPALTACCCFPGESGSLAPPCLTSHIIAGASAAAAGLFLLLVAFLCFRKTQARKGAAPRPSSTSPMGALKASAQQDPVYSSIDEGKEPQTLEPDPSAQGLTYAELDVQVLQAKQGKLAPAPESAEPSVYAAINRARGAPQ